MRWFDVLIISLCLKNASLCVTRRAIARSHSDERSRFSGRSAALSTISLLSLAAALSDEGRRVGVDEDGM